MLKTVDLTLSKKKKAVTGGVLIVMGDDDDNFTPRDIKSIGDCLVLNTRRNTTANRSGEAISI